MKCSTDTLLEKDPGCSDGDPTNVLDWTMFGLVGHADSDGAFLLGSSWRP